MPLLSEIQYSREATVAAVSAYFDFLASMYLDDEAILGPPNEGWPEMTPDRLRGLRKTDEVVMLLRHLPYLHGGEFDYCKNAIEMSTVMTEFRPDEDIGSVPSHVVGLISTKQDLWLLDTELGVVYWLDCPGWIKHHPTREPILDDPDDYAPEGETGWRCEPAWAIADFFELLKDQFRRLSSIPITPTLVLDLKGVKLRARYEGALPLVQAVYREHGWPDLARYRKDTCLEAVRRKLEERY
ncbi:hypothetical protein N658DRAFT_387008, partial [Parathielavia hyrcaniae]